MKCYLFILGFAFFDLVAAGARRERLRQGAAFVRSVSSLRHRLRVCHAYPHDSALDVYVDDAKVTNYPISYKTCLESGGSLRAGSRIDFRIGDRSVGSFAVSDLPSSDSVLLLAIYRHDAVKTEVNFVSHVFTSLKNAQLAVLDTYVGSKEGKLRIVDADDKGKLHRSNPLTYDSVVAIAPGVYHVMLTGWDSHIKAEEELVALEDESYVALRCGVEAEVGDSYPQDLVIFPHSEKPKPKPRKKKEEEEGGGEERSAASARSALLALALWSVTWRLLVA